MPTTKTRPASPARPAPKRWTAPRIEELMTKILADMLNKDPKQLRKELLAKDNSMPVDSLNLIEAQVEFSKAADIKLPARIPSKVMRSLKEFSRFAAAAARKQ
jgi:acyl carrier protein